MSAQAELDPLGRKLAKALLEAQGPEGGFGYLAGQPGATEPTALASLALSCCAFEAAKEAGFKARRWLIATQLPFGGWPTRPPDTEASWAGALALLALSTDGEGREARQRGLHWLLTTLGRRVKVDAAVFAIDGTLQGWPWAPGNFSWVEPTSYALIALKKLKDEAGEASLPRINEGEALLFDRVVDKGGWNYGNRQVYGQHYEAYAETTALALIALQEHASRPDIQRSLATLLWAVGHGSPSGLQVGWAMLSLGVLGLSPKDLSRRLAEIYHRNGFLGRVPTLAVALMAVSGAAGAGLFRLGGPA